MLSRFLNAFTAVEVSAHCDLPCGVYDPAQAKIEAESVKACITKFNASDDDPYWVVESSKSGKQAAHKESSLS